VYAHTSEPTLFGWQTTQWLLKVQLPSGTHAKNPSTVNDLSNSGSLSLLFLLQNKMGPFDSQNAQSWPSTVTREARGHDASYSQTSINRSSPPSQGKSVALRLTGGGGNFHVPQETKTVKYCGQSLIYFGRFKPLRRVTCSLTLADSMKLTATKDCSFSVPKRSVGWWTVWEVQTDGCVDRRDCDVGFVFSPLSSITDIFRR
jgi:hypothetical protein